jgi:uncharacterized membrane protein
MHGPMNVKKKKKKKRKKKRKKERKKERVKKTTTTTTKPEAIVESQNCHTILNSVKIIILVQITTSLHEEKISSVPTNRMCFIAVNFCYNIPTICKEL